MTAQIFMHQEQGRYSIHPAVVGFTPELGNRYAYFFSEAGPLASRALPDVPLEATGIGVDLKRAPLWLTPADLPVLTGGLGPGLWGECAGWELRPSASPPCAMVVACAGQPDDDELDVWSVSTVDRWTPAGTLVPAREPFREPPAE